MEKFSLSSDGFIVVSDDLKEKYRYNYLLFSDHDIIPGIIILCEEKEYRIIPSVAPTHADGDCGIITYDIRNFELDIVNRIYTEKEADNFLTIKSSTTNIEKKIAAFTDSLIIAENIMDIIDRCYFSSDGSIYR